MPTPRNVTIEHSDCDGKPSSWRSKLARAGEDAAAKHFANLGANIRERNWRQGRYAEIDLIVELDGVTVFVEVKTRRRPPAYSGHMLSGFESINWRKQKKIVTAARLYFARKRLVEPLWRVDVVVVEYVMSAELIDEQELPVPQIIHVADAICM